MSLRHSVRAVGQRLLVGFTGLEVSAELKELLREHAVGGVVLFARNVEAPEQVAELVREIQAVARDAGHDRPLLVAVDQEGGRVLRLRRPWTEWPPLRALGRSGSEDLSARMGRGLARELLACGIGFDLAPVMDVDTNKDNPVIGDRAFGDDPELVGRMGAAMIRAMQGAGLAACAKHFPGHGDTASDSHHDLPVVAHSRSRLEDVELRPFRAAIASGAASIMVGHLLVPELDDELPASMSRPIVTALLRETMGFRGVVVADDLEMKAVAARWPMGEVAVRAALAGVDLIPICARHELQVEAAEALVHAVEDERIAWKEMEDSLLRIQRLEDAFLLPYRDPDPRQARAEAGGAEQRELAQEIAERGGVPA